MRYGADQERGCGCTGARPPYHGMRTAYLQSRRPFLFDDPHARRSIQGGQPAQLGSTR